MKLTTLLRPLFAAAAFASAACVPATAEMRHITPSSFQDTCSAITIAGTMIWAQCLRRDGTLKSTSIAIYRIENIDGDLRVTGAASSSFQLTCRDISISGDLLSASCRRADRTWKQTSLRIPGIANLDGDLDDHDAMFIAYPAPPPDYAACNDSRSNLLVVRERIDACSRIIESPNETAADRFVARVNRGNGNLAAGNIDDAIRDFDEAIALDPRNVAAYASRAIGYGHKGERAEAVADIRKARELDRAKLAELVAANAELRALAAEDEP